MSKWYRKNAPGGAKEAAPPSPPPEPVVEDQPDPEFPGVEDEYGTDLPPVVEPSGDDPTGVYKDVPFYETEDGFYAVVNGEELTSPSKKGIKNAIKRRLEKDEGGNNEPTDA